MLVVYLPFISDWEDSVGLPANWGCNGKGSENDTPLLFLTLFWSCWTCVVCIGWRLDVKYMSEFTLYKVYDALRRS